MRAFSVWAIAGPLILSLAASPAAALAQYIDQAAVAAILKREQVPLETLPEVSFELYVLDHPSGNSLLARSELYRAIGGGDLMLGRERARLAELLNRRLLVELGLGDTLVLPKGEGAFELDFRAYSPFPLQYSGGRVFDKLFVIDKGAQAFAAYEQGRLVRWGNVNTGGAGHSTPAGRYNFNWKEEYRVSSLSPEDEPWEMRWVFNFHEKRGMHVHQYDFPAGAPESHGCVRLIDADARWIYEWADGWKRERGGPGADYGGRLIQPGTTVLILADDPVERPEPFRIVDGVPVLKRVQLPSDPYDVPPGTPQQERFDRLRGAS